MDGLGFSSQNELKLDVQAWLAAFTPLVMGQEAPTESLVMRRLGAIEDLKRRAPLLRMKLGDLDPEDNELAATFRRAVDQLPSLEEEARTVLGKMRPGDPRGIPDMDRLNEALIQREARQEIGAPPVSLSEEVLVEKASPSQPAAGAMQGIFALGWLGFTTFHMIIMVGGMAAAFGPLALMVVLFYLIFYAAGAGIAYSAFTSAAEEEIVLHGRTIEIKRSLGPIQTKKVVELAPDTLPRLGRPRLAVSSSRSSAQNYAQPPSIILTDVHGRDVAFGAGMTSEAKEKLSARVSAYLKTHG